MKYLCCNQLCDGNFVVENEISFSTIFSPWILIFDEFRIDSSSNQSKGPAEAFDSSEIAPDTPSDSEEGDNDLNDYDNFVCK